MSDNIVTEKKMNFKEMEERFFKCACEIVNYVMKETLEKYDEQIMKTRDKKRFRNKGKERTSIKTKTGIVEYERTRYIEKKDDGSKSNVYLLDEEIGITNVLNGTVSQGLIEVIVKNISELSYRACSNMLEQTTGMYLSSTAIWNIIQDLGTKITAFEDNRVECKKEEQLKCGKKYTPAIFQEADGIMIVMQGKDRKIRKEKYQEEHPGEEVPKRVRNAELKLGITYEGWKKDGKNRYKLIGKEYIAGFMDGDKMAELMQTSLYSKYDVGKIELNVTNSDGASWILKLVPKNGIYQADQYHVIEKIKQHVKEKEDLDVVLNLYYKRDAQGILEYIEELKKKCGGEYEEVKKLDELTKYIGKRKDQLARYNENEEIKKKLKVYHEQTGLLYRNAGCQESNNYCELTRRFKRRRMSWSEKGATNLAKVITTKDSESCSDIFEYLKIDISAESYRDFVDKHVEAIEENVRKMKELKRLNKTNKKKEISITQAIVNGPNVLKKLLKDKSFSELVYR